MTYVYPGQTIGWYPQHCAGCRCGQSWTWTTTGPFVHTTPYQPKHRKPGPAQ